MYRLFVGIDLPSDVADQLVRISNGLPGARWLNPEQLHLTLRFIGEVDGGVFADARGALDTVDMHPFELSLKGVGFFPPRGRAETLWVGIEKSEPLLLLHQKIETALSHSGIQKEQRKFVPHIAIARIRETHANRLGPYIVANSLFETSPLWVDSFHLYTSHLSSSGASYSIEHSYPLYNGSARDEKSS
jgi:2'-5' RNA ligase